MVRYLLVVERTQPDLWPYLKNNSARDEKVEVSLDRRRGERRQRLQPHEPERRQVDRRRRPTIDKDFSYRVLGDCPPAVDPRLLHHSRRRPGVELVRHPDGPLEIRLSGLVEAAERRARRWRMAVLVLLAGLVVGASFAVAILALRWDYQRGQTLQLLRADLEIAQARSHCWEALARYLPESPKDVIPDARRGGRVRQCVATELARRTAKP